MVKDHFLKIVQSEQPSLIFTLHDWALPQGRVIARDSLKNFEMLEPIYELLSHFYSSTTPIGEK
jgi:hypothetical protein